MPSITNKIARRFRDYGFWPTVRYAGYSLYDGYQSWHLGIGSAMRASRIYIPQAESGLPSTEYCSHHPTTSYYMFRHVFDRYVQPTNRDVFLDWGSGTGRVLIMAGATYPFGRMIGVEYDKELLNVSRQIMRSVKHSLRCQNVELLNADAISYAVPPDVTVMYFYNPFGPRIMQGVCQRIRESLACNPREIRVVCYRPQVFEETTAGYNCVTKIAEVRIPCVSRNSISVFKILPQPSPKRQLPVTLEAI